MNSIVKISIDSVRSIILIFETHPKYFSKIIGKSITIDISKRETLSTLKIK